MIGFVDRCPYPITGGGGSLYCLGMSIDFSEFIEVSITMKNDIEVLLEDTPNSLIG